MKSRIYSAVVDPVGPFSWQASQLTWSLIHLAGVSPSQIVLHVVNAGSDPVALSSLQSLGVEIAPVDPFPGHVYCNKLQQLPSLGPRDFDDVVLLDCDVLVLEEPPSAQGGVLAKPVDFANPPIDVLQRLFDLAGLELTPATTDIDRGATARGNANGGVYVVSRRVFDRLAHEWRRWADWCLERRELFGDKWMHIDQVSFAMAIASSGMPFRELNRRFNVPTHAPQPPALDCDPAILHYHRAVDSQQLLLPVQGLSRVNDRIRSVNERLLAERWKKFDNPVFWNARYAMHPDLGSGIGSRGTTLAGKQQLLRRVAKLLDARSVLDVGGGDGRTASVLPDNVSVHAVDVATSSRKLYLEVLPRASWSQHDFVAGPAPVHADLVVCLDVLIHMSSHQDYRAMVKNLLSYGVPVLLSGFDAAPAEFGPMTYFVEPLSSSIEGHGFVAMPVDAYRDVTVFIALPPRPAATAEDIRDITLREARSLVAEPLLLVEAVIRSRATLGFFPDHLPSCIAYPWIVQRLSGADSLRIVCAGAGDGVLPLMLAERGHHVITFEFDRRIASRNGSYEDAPNDRKLDAVVSVSVIGHLSRAIRKEWLRKAAKQIKRGGSLLLTVDTIPFSKMLWNYSEGRQVEDPEIHGSIDELALDLADAGFEVELIEHSVWLPKSRVGMARIKASRAARAALLLRYSRRVFGRRGA